MLKSRQSAKRPVVLVVDRAVENIVALGRALHQDFEVCFATDPEQIPERLDGAELILLNAGLDGCQVCRRWKQGEPTRSIPIILLADSEDEQAAAAARVAGAADYLSRPLGHAHLRARIHTQLRREWPLR